MATVYRARQASMDRDVAVKIIHANLLDEVGRERFQREARLIARLEHPHILPVYDFDGNHEPPYIVMRYLAGGTLKDAMNRGRLSCNDSVHVLRQISAALDYAHQQGIIHRDLKPSNILIDQFGNAFLTDFGFARFTGETTLTASGTAVGTPAYMAPEQAMGASDVGPRVDLYALGVLTFELLTGRLPFQSESLMTLLYKHIQEAPPLPTECNPALPTAVDEVLLRALAKHPDDRYASAGELVIDLTRALNLTITAIPTELQTAPDQPKAAVAPGTYAHTPPTEQNKLVTAVYADAAEYFEIVDESQGNEIAHQAMQALWELARHIVDAHAGQVIMQSETDWLALWGAETTHEDDAERAVRTAIDLQAALRKLGAGQFIESEDEPLPIKISVNTGAVLLSFSEKTSTYSTTGAPITLAQRLSEQAGGAILITHDTFREVRGVFDMLPDMPIKVRGRKAGIEGATLLPTYRVIAAKARTFRVRPRGLEGLETPLVSRRAELETLQNAFLDALEEHETQVITVLGAAGLGKSRLLDEFNKWADLRPETWLTFEGRATTALTKRPYALLREVLSFRFEILDNDLPTVLIEKMEKGVLELLGQPDPEIAHLMGYLAGFDFSQSPHVRGLLGDPRQLTARARQLFIRFFTHLGAREAMVIMLEDIHYADEASLDLFTELVNAQPGLPLVLVCLARPELLERRPAWGQGQSFHKRLTLEPLDRRASRDLAGELLQKVPQPSRSLRDLLVERAEGNPLFMEELVKMLLEDRVLVKESENTWRVEESRLGSLRVPPTLAGLLQARFDSLLYPEKLTLQRASVLGRIFYDTALAALDAADESSHVTDLPGMLKHLEEREFIYRRETSSFAGSREYIFAQTMLRDQIYATLVSRQIKTYHAAMARWLAASERAGEYQPLIAEHFEKASDKPRAAQALARAAERAVPVSALAEAEAFYQKALVLTPAISEWLCKLGEVYLYRGDYSAAQRILQEAQSAARTDAERAAALAGHGMILTRMGDYVGASALLSEALPLARASGDQATLARVLFALGDVDWLIGKLDEARAWVDECLGLARLLGDITRELLALNLLAGVFMIGGDWREAERLCKEVHTRAIAVGNRERAMVALSNLGAVMNEHRDFNQAKVYTRQALELARELGAQHSIALCLLSLAELDIQLGQLTEARACLREGLTLARRMGATPRVVSSLMVFARLAYAEGQEERALALLGMAQRHPAWHRDHQREMDEALAQWNLDPAVVEAGLARGTELDFEATIQELL